MRPGNCWVVAGVAVLAETPWTQEAADVLSIADSFQQQGEWQGAIVQYQRGYLPKRVVDQNILVRLGGIGHNRSYAFDPVDQSSFVQDNHHLADEWRAW